MRVFAALNLPEGLESEIACLARSLKQNVSGRYVASKNYHLTLAFIGEIPTGDVDACANALRRACELAADPMELKPVGLGKFGRRNNAMLWLDIAENPALEELASTLREGLAEEGIAFDGKAFKPHITIARHADLTSANIGALPFLEAATATSASLYKSILDPEGAIYEPLETFQLG